MFVMTQRQSVSSVVSTTCEMSSGSDGGSSENDDVDMEVSLEDITDEEALLACHSYLLRRKRLPWKQHEIRKTLQRRSPSIGYFWEDPSELKYLSSSDDNDYDDYDDESSQQTDQEEEYIRGGEFFSIHPWNPSESYRRKSEAKKKLFQNSSWKTKWYQARWGSPSTTTVSTSTNSDDTSSSSSSNNDRKSERLVKAIPAEILRSPELAALTETEIEHAIITYITANRKRSIKQKLKQKSIPNNIIANNAQKNITGAAGFEIHPSSPQIQQQLLQKQQERSQRAKKAYQTRRSNEQQQQQQKLNHNNKPTIKRQKNIIFQDQEYTSTQDTSPYAAIDSLAQCVLLSPSSTSDHVIIHQRNDVISVLRPLRLARRKSILQQILFQIFDKRGKSIPIISTFNDDTTNINTILYNTTTSSLEYKQAWNQLMTSYHNHENDRNPSYKFVTKCTNQELGLYILYLINIHISLSSQQQQQQQQLNTTS